MRMLPYPKGTQKLTERGAKHPAFVRPNFTLKLTFSIHRSRQHQWPEKSQWTTRECSQWSRQKLWKRILQHFGQKTVIQRNRSCREYQSWLLFSCSWTIWDRSCIEPHLELQKNNKLKSKIKFIEFFWTNVSPYL